jgi:TusA-related sulfurtransferase
VIAAAGRVDVRAFACPLTWVKTRIALERIRPGERVEVLLRAGEPLASVPRTAEEEGHRVVSVEPLEGAGAGEDYRVVLERGGGEP